MINDMVVISFNSENKKKVIDNEEGVLAPTNTYPKRTGRYFHRLVTATFLRCHILPRLLASMCLMRCHNLLQLIPSKCMMSATIFSASTADT